MFWPYLPRGESRARQNRSPGGPLLQKASSSDRKATATNRIHSNDLEACVMKCCCFWFHSVVMIWYQIFDSWIHRGTLEIVIQEVLWSIWESYSAIWSIPLTNVKWHSDPWPTVTSQPIRLSTNFMTLIPSLTFTDYEWFPWSICNGCGMPAGNAYPSGHLVPSPILGLANAPIVETKFLELAMSLLDFSPRIPLGTFSILLIKEVLIVLRWAISAPWGSSILYQIQLFAFHKCTCMLLFCSICTAILRLWKGTEYIRSVVPTTLQKYTCLNLFLNLKNVVFFRDFNSFLYIGD